MGLLDVLDESSRRGTTVEFLRTGSEPELLGVLTREAEGVAGAVQSLQGDNGGVGIVLTNTRESVKAVLAALRAGVTIVSLPQPVPGQGRVGWAGRLAGVCSRLGVQSVLVEGRENREALQAVGRLRAVSVRSLEGARCSAADASLRGDARPALVQLTSGTTGAAGAVALTGDQILEHVESILHRLEVQDGDAACSWLPLSHDMGLIGMFFSTLVAGGVRCEAGSRLTLLEPRRFVARPGTWPRACAARGATITAGPQFALRMLSDAQHTYDGWGRLRALLAGAELVLPQSVGTGSTRFGLSPGIVRPAYGLAEATLAVCIAGPDVLEPQPPLEENPPFSDRTYVSCGAPLSGVDVRVDAAPGAVGAIELRGRSVAGRIEDATSWTADGWLRTGDLGFLVSDQLFPVGRYDDVVSVRGRQISGTALSSLLRKLDGLRSERVMVVNDPAGDLAVAFEPTAAGRAGIDDLARSIRRAVGAACGIAPVLYVFPPSGLPVTASGKLGRAAVEACLVGGDPAERGVLRLGATR